MSFMNMLRNIGSHFGGSHPGQTGPGSYESQGIDPSAWQTEGIQF